MIKPEGSGIYPIHAKITELDNIVSQMPKIFGAKVDHRLLHDTWIWVKPLYQVEAREYLINVLKIPCVSLDISEKWYYFK